MFTLTNPNNAPLKLPIQGPYVGYATNSHGSFGPMFGSTDLRINDNCNSVSNDASINYYTFPNGQFSITARFEAMRSRCIALSSIWSMLAELLIGQLNRRPLDPR